METNNFPQDWNVSPLRDLTLKFLNGGTPSTANPQYWDGDIPWITGADAENFVTVTARKSVTAKGIRESSTNVVPRSNILLVTRTGVGKVSIAGVDVAISQDLTGLIVNPDLVDAKFLCRQLLRLTPTLKRFAQGTIIEGIERTEVERLQIPIPATVKEQHHIANILDTVDEAIRQTEAIIAKLKQIKAGLLHDLLTCGVDENGELRDPVTHPGQFQETEIGLIPSNWSVQTLADVATVERGKFAHRPRNEPRFYGGQYPFIQTGDVTKAEGGIIFDFSQTLNDKGIKISREFPAQTIAITIAANIADTAILGRSMFFPDSIVGAVVTSPNNVRYIELCIRRAKAYLDSSAPQSAQKNINLVSLRTLKIPVPNPDEQSQIALIYENCDSEIQLEFSYLAKLQHLKQGLMQDLLTGSVRVNEINFDLPEA